MRFSTRSATLRDLALPRVLAALAASACSGSSASPHGAVSIDGGVCPAPGVSTACASCLGTACASPSSAAQVDCASTLACYCACKLGDVCCVEACGSPPNGACVADAKDFATCAIAECPSECTVTVPVVCSSGSDASAEAGPIDP